MLYQLKHKSSPGEIKKKLCLLKSTFNNWLILKKNQQKTNWLILFVGQIGINKLL